MGLSHGACVFDIGPLEMIALVVLAILLFGPEKLPKVAADAARMIRQFRQFTQNARADIGRELGPEFADLSIEDLNPRTFVRKNLLGDGKLLDDLDLDLDLDFAADDVVVPKRNGYQERVKPDELPPYDPDAT
jgi:sec-independent protein translocase protein TatB